MKTCLERFLAIINNGEHCLPCNLIFTQENARYGACRFELLNRQIEFRCAKQTPTKQGNFVVFWKRAVDGHTIPYGQQDSVDMLVVVVKTEIESGFFIFPRSVLVAQRILTTSQSEGKRGFRVYTPGEILESSQAKKTQAWQKIYFLPDNVELVDGERFKNLMMQN